MGKISVSNEKLIKVYEVYLETTKGLTVIEALRKHPNWMSDREYSSILHKLRLYAHDPKKYYFFFEKNKEYNRLIFEGSCPKLQDFMAAHMPEMPVSALNLFRAHLALKARLATLLSLNPEDLFVPQEKELMAPMASHKINFQEVKVVPSQQVQHIKTIEFEKARPDLEILIKKGVRLLISPEVQSSELISILDKIRII